MSDRRDFVKKGVLTLIPNRQRIWHSIQLVKEANEIKSAIETQVLDNQGRIRSIFGVHEQFSNAVNLFKDEELLKTVKNILSPDIYLFQSQLNIKFKGEEGQYAPHRDMHYFQSRDGVPNASKMLGVAFNIVEITDEMGPLQMYEGSHKSFKKLNSGFSYDGKQSLKHSPNSTGDKGIVSYDEMKANSHLEIKSFAGPQGQVTIFDPRAIHWSTSNLTINPRYLLLAFFNQLENRPIETTSPWFLSNNKFLRY